MRLLNVGLELPDGSVMHVPDVIRVLGKYGITVTKWRVAPAGRSEPTLIVASEGGASMSAVYRVADELNQDAIALYDMDELKGEVVGPRDGKWAPFDATYFQVY